MNATHAIWGALAMGCAVIALFFVRYWRASHDRIFLFFTAAFIALGINWAGLAAIEGPPEQQHRIYVIRLIAFVLILVGVIDKNRRQ
jgi:4-hydroxybenzoate polyprenyltransferase